MRLVLVELEKEMVQEQIADNNFQWMLNK